MSTERTLKIESTSSSATLELAQRIGHRLKGGEVIELISDLGGGKTTFVRGLAQGMGSGDSVHSPSFTLSNEYAAGELVLHHLDFYRLQQPGIMREELAEMLGDPKAVVAVEWADIVEDVLPATRLTVRIRATGDTRREFSVQYPGSLKYLIQEET